LNCEINQLQAALNILSQFKGMPQFEWINELIPKLRQGIPNPEKPNPIIEFDSNNYLKGIEHLGLLYNSIYFKKVIKITYQPFDVDHSINFVIHPYYLKQYNNRWFLFGFNEEKTKYNWNIALDRIKNIEETNQKFHKNNSIDWLEYFDDIIGVTKHDNCKIESILLHFFGKTGKYIESKPLHGSQKIKWINSSTKSLSKTIKGRLEFANANYE